MSERPGKLREARVFARRAYLSKEAKEMVNRSSRRIYLNEPDYVENPEEPQLEDVIREIRLTGGDGTVDAPLFAELLGAGLSYQETIYYYLWRYAGYDFSDIIRAETGKEIRFKARETEVRSVKTTIRKAANKLEDEQALERLD